MPDTADNLTKCKPAPLFKPELREQIRLGNKTQTRRPLKHQPFNDDDESRRWLVKSGRSEFATNERRRDVHEPDGAFVSSEAYFMPVAEWLAERAPYQPGDILYLREPLARSTQNTVMYDDDAEPVCMHDGGWIDWQWQRSKLPSIHMPKRFARTFLRVTDVRVERVQDISDEDTRAEGCGYIDHDTRDGHERRISVRKHFRELWDRIHGDGAWSRNDYVWAYTFELTDNPNRKGAIWADQRT